MKDKGKFIFILGGARSGKSKFAEDLANSLGNKVLYIATAAVLDNEMRRRVEIHRKRRPESWSTEEETQRVSKVIDREGENYPVILIDCLTLLVSNLLLDENFPETRTEMSSSLKEQAILKEIKNLSISAQKAKAHVILVSNEIGSGIVPDNEMARLYRDIAGWANQKVAAYADEVYLTVAGLPVELKELSRQVNERYGIAEGD